MPREYPPHAVTIELDDGTRLESWSDIDVTHDMFNLGNPWTVTLWRSSRSDAAALWETVCDKALLETHVRVLIDGALQVTGRIEDRIDDAAGHEEGASITISGRDLAGRAIDSDADPTITLKDVMLEDALVRLFEDIGITPRLCDAARARIIQSIPRRARGRHTRPRRKNVIATLKVQIGERILPRVQKLCAQLGFMVWLAPASSPDTVELVVDTPYEGDEISYAFARRAVGSSFEGNIEHGRRRVCSRDVPTIVTGFVGSSSSSDVSHNDRVAEVNQWLRHNPMVKPTLPLGLLPRPRYIKPQRARTAESVSKECQRVIAKSAQDFLTYELTTRGFGQEGKLFALNSLAYLHDDALRPNVRGEWLLTRVHFHQSQRRGQLSELRLHPKGLVRVYPEDAT